MAESDLPPDQGDNDHDSSSNDNDDGWHEADDDGSRRDTLGAGARLAAVIVGLALVLGLVAAATTIGVSLLRDTGDGGAREGRADSSELFVINLDDDQVIIVERDEGADGGVSGDLFVVRLAPDEEVDVAGLVSSSRQCTTQDLVALDPDGNELGVLDSETCYEEGHDWTVDP